MLELLVKCSESITLAIQGNPKGNENAHEVHTSYHIIIEFVIGFLFYFCDIINNLLNLFIVNMSWTLKP
jgi:hypothetical protein